MKKLVESLRNGSIGQRYFALKKLIQHSREERDHDRAREHAVKLFCTRLSNNNYRGMSEAFSKLIGKNTMFN